MQSAMLAMAPVMEWRGDRAWSMASLAFFLHGERNDDMAAALDNSERLTTLERELIAILRRDGTQTIESLVQRSGFEWAQVFGAIDSLSRSGEVRLRREEGHHYQVSLKERAT